MISLEQYLKDRNLKFPSFYTSEIESSAIAFLEQLNSFLVELKIDPDSLIINSGWRPEPLNAAVGGALHSYHALGRAIDLRDLFPHELASTISTHPEVLRRHGLWLEDPFRTPSWVHIDNGDRQDRPTRIFFV